MERCGLFIVVSCLFTEGSVFVRGLESLPGKVSSGGVQCLGRGSSLVVLFRKTRFLGQVWSTLLVLSRSCFSWVFYESFSLKMNGGMFASELLTGGWVASLSRLVWLSGVRGTFLLWGSSTSTGGARFPHVCFDPSLQT